MNANITCAFDPQACRHPSLFVAEYKRTNRTKGTKILRCFPHCCPEHVNRSYCGSGLYVSVTNARPDLVVFAHFEESDANFLSVGDEIDVNTVAESIQTEQTPKGEWIEGFSQSSACQTTHLFEINPGARWYYEWESAATKAQRFTKHVLRVYVFERVAKHEPSAQAMLHVVALTTSSEFMVVSYRRATAELRADRRILAMLADSAGTGHAVQAIVDVDRKEVLLPLQQQLQLLSTSSPEHQSLMPWSQQSPPYRGVDRAPDTQELGKAMWQELKLWESSHPETLLKSKHLTILCAFLMNVDALQFTHILSHWSTIFADLVDNCPLSPTNQQRHFPGGETNQLIPVGHSRISWYFLTKLAAQQRHQQQQTGHPMQPQAPETVDALSHLVQTCAALVGWLVFDGNNLSLYRELFAEYTNVLLDKDALRGSFIKWINLVYDLIDRFLALSPRGGQPLFPSMRVLAEEIISIAFKRDDLQTLRAAVLSALSATSMMGLQSFVAQVRSNFVRTQVESPRSRTTRGMALTRVLQRFASPFQGSWCFDGTQTVIEQVPSGDVRGISVLDLLDWMRECGSVTLQVDDDERIYVRSMWSLTAPEDGAVDQRGMLLIADTHARVFSHFPSGLSSMIPLGGRNFGDYHAHFASPDVLVLELYAWPESAAGPASTASSSHESPGVQAWAAGASPAASSPPAVRWVLRLSIEQVGGPSSATHSSILRVEAVVEHALQREPLAEGSSCSIQEKLVVVDHWEPAFRMSAVYRRVH